MSRTAAAEADESESEGVVPYVEGVCATVDATLLRIDKMNGEPDDSESSSP